MTWHRYELEGKEPDPCSSVDEFMHSLVDMPESSEPRTKFIFRGHSSQHYQLLPTALRVQDGNNEEAIGTWGPLGVRAIENEVDQRREELRLIKLFCKMAEASGMPLPGLDKPGLRDSLLSDGELKHIGTYNESGYGPEYQWPPEELLPVLALMQHYGMPTRLLDWSISPLTAGYFALSGVKSCTGQHVEESDKVQIWALSVREIDSADNFNQEVLHSQSERGSQVFLRRFPYRIVRTPTAQNPNLRYQQGVFTVKIIYQEVSTKAHIPTTRTQFHDDVLSDSFFKPGGITKNNPTPQFDNVPRFYRLSLPAHLAMEALQRLHSIGYSGSRLFEGYNGVVKSASEHIRIEQSLRQRF